MGKYLLPSLLLLTAISVSGCDFFRTIAGRPTSADLERKRERIEAAATAAAEAGREAASVEVKPVELDSLAALDSIRLMGCSMFGKGRLGGTRDVLEHEYYIIIGSFQSSNNAGKQALKAIDAGFDAVVITSRKGLYVAAAAPADSPAGIYENLKALRRNAFCPKDAWILVNR